MSIFDKFLKYFKESKPVTIGEEFPYKNQVIPGDFSRPMLTAESIDVLISLTNLSKDERKAIGNNQFEIFIQETALAPMVVLKFGNIFTIDFSINLVKMDKDFVNIWLNSENTTMKIYLLEGTDSTVQCVRYVPFQNMKYLKNLCERQLESSARDIDEWIMMCNNRYNTEDIIQNARVHEVIPAVKFSL